MNGFLITAQYLLDDIPLQLCETRQQAEDWIRALRSYSPQTLHDATLVARGVLGRDASLPCEGAELALIEFDTLGVVCEHESFELIIRD